MLYAMLADIHFFFVGPQSFLFRGDHLFGNAMGEKLYPYHLKNWKKCTNVRCGSEPSEHNLKLWDVRTIIGFARIAWIRRTLNRVQFVEKALKNRSQKEDTKPNRYFVQF